MLYREMEEEEYMNMKNETIINPEQPSMYESPMMQQQMYENPIMQCPMYQNPMMQYQMKPQWMPQIHHMGCPMMSGMYNPSTYAPQVERDEYDLEEGFDENMERSPHNSHYDNHHNNHDHYPSHSYYNHSYYPYNPYFQNYYPFYNFNPLLIPLLLGRD